MKRVIVIGCPGSGKSTFSVALHKATGILLFHLDQLYWNADKTTVEKSVFHRRLANVLDQDAWILDGNYASTMEWRMQACDTVIFLDYPVEVCLQGVAQRRGKPRGDIPWVETEEDEEFTEFIRCYRRDNRPQVLELLAKYADKSVFIFTDRTQAEEFLNKVIL